MEQKIATFIYNLAENLSKNSRKFWKTLSANRGKCLKRILPNILDDKHVTDKNFIDILFEKFKNIIGIDPPNGTENYK